MSYCAMLVADSDGDLWVTNEFSNSHLFCMLIWREFAKRYLGDEKLVLSFDETDIQKVWDLWKHPMIDPRDRATMAATFDDVLVRGEDIPRLIECFEYTAQWVQGSHLEAMVDALRIIADTTVVRAVGWWGTSVGENPWQIPMDDYDDDLHDDDSYSEAAYNIDTGDKHWWLFEALDAQEPVT